MATPKPKVSHESVLGTADVKPAVNDFGGGKHFTEGNRIVTTPERGLVVPTAKQPGKPATWLPPAPPK